MKSHPSVLNQGIVSVPPEEFCPDWLLLSVLPPAGVLPGEGEGEGAGEADGEVDGEGEGRGLAVRVCPASAKRMSATSSRFNSLPLCITDWSVTKLTWPVERRLSRITTKSVSACSSGASFVAPPRRMSFTRERSTALPLT